MKGETEKQRKTRTRTAPTSAGRNTVRPRQAADSDIAPERKTSERRPPVSSEGSTPNVSSMDPPPAVPSDSPGSSVSTRLQEEYDELLKYAVVVPDYNPKDVHASLTGTRGLFDKQDDIITLRASGQPVGPMQGPDEASERENQTDEEYGGETTPRTRIDNLGGGVQQLPDFGESPIDSPCPVSFTQQLRADTSGDRGAMLSHTQLTFANVCQHNSKGGAKHQGPGLRKASSSSNTPGVSNGVKMSYTTTLDRDVGKMEALMDEWCLDLKRNVLAEFSQAKIVIEQKSREDLLREAGRHCKDKDELIKEMDSLKELLHTYEKSSERKDTIIANLTKAMYRQRDKQQLMKNFCSWKAHHNDMKRETFTLKLAKQHHERTLQRRVMSAWFSMLHSKWKQRVEKACQTKAQEVCMQLTNDYEAKITSMNDEREATQIEIRRLHKQRETYEETMKKAFMRGVCALNMEAMSMFHGDEGANDDHGGGGGGGGRDEEPEREERYPEYLDSQGPSNGAPSTSSAGRASSPPRRSTSPPKFTKVTPHNCLGREVVISQGSRSASATGAKAPTKQGSGKHQMCAVTANLVGKGAEPGRPGNHFLNPSGKPPAASVIVERHQPVTKETVGQAAAVKFSHRSSESDKFKKIAGQKIKHPQIHTVSLTVD